MLDGVMENPADMEPPSELPGNPKDRILAATFRVVARKTISGTRIPAIAAEAGVSQGILFYYFETKEKLLLSLLDWLFAAFRSYRGISSRRRIDAPDPGSQADAKRAFLQYVQLLIEAEPEMIRVFYDFWVQAAGGSEPFETAVKSQFRVYRSDVAQMLSTDDHREDQIDVHSGLIVSLFEGAVLQLMLDRDSFDFENYMNHVSKFIDELRDRRESQQVSV